MRVPSKALIEAVIKVESNGNPKAVSPSGAQGLMQLMPGTFREWRKRLCLPGDSDPFHGPTNVFVGTAYLTHLLNRFHDIECAIAAYNAGPGTITKALHNANGQTLNCIVSELPRETQKYVPKVLAALGGSSPFEELT